MTTKEEIITHILKEPMYKQIVKNVCKGEGDRTQLVDDMFQEIIIHLWEQPLEYLIAQHENNLLKQTIASFAIKFWKVGKNKSGSKFWVNCRRHFYLKDDDMKVDLVEADLAPNEQEDLQEFVNEVTNIFENEIDEVDREIFKLYHFGDFKTYPDVANALGIGRSSVIKSVHRVNMLCRIYTGVTQNKKNIW